MIRVIGSNKKFEIANAIQQYNKAEIYVYDENHFLFTHCYHANPNDETVESFCKFIINNLESKAKIKDSYIPMAIIYTNLYEPIKIAIVENYIKEMENAKLVGNVVFMTR